MEGGGEERTAGDVTVVPADPDRAIGCPGLGATDLGSAGPKAGLSPHSEVSWQNLLWEHPSLSPTHTHTHTHTQSEPQSPAHSLLLGSTSIGFLLRQYVSPEASPGWGLPF